MSIPDPISRVHYDQPRAVLIREPNDPSSKHSAVHSGINVYTNSKKEADYLMFKWPELMEKLSIEIDIVFNEMPVDPPVII